MSAGGVSPAASLVKDTRPSPCKQLCRKTTRRANHLRVFAQRSPAPPKKIFRLIRRANHGYDSRRLAPTRGALRGRHGRWARDAVDVEVPLTNGADADGEVVWS
jgi:hypothetical protein